MNIRASTQTTAIRAAFNEVWPEGYDRLCTMSIGSCHSGRTRPSDALTNVVTSVRRDGHQAGVDRGPAVAAHHQQDDEHERGDRHRHGVEPDLDEAQHVTQRAVLVGPVLEPPPEVVERAQRGAISA